MQERPHVRKDRADHNCVACKLEWKKRNKKPANAKELQRAREWHAANPEKAKAATKKWRAANREAVSRASLAWQASNPEKVNAIRQRFKVNNPGIWNAYAAKRRGAQDRQTPAWADHDAINAMYALAAIYRDFGYDVHVDHEIPIQGKKVSGLHVHQNLQIIPASVNRSKSNQFSI